VAIAPGRVNRRYGRTALAAMLPTTAQSGAFPGSIFMRRREFIAAVGGSLAGAAAWPRSPAAQGGRIRHVVVWIGGSAGDPTSQQRAQIFRETMSALGWVDGRNVRIEARFPITNAPEETRAAAAALVALNPDAIVTTGAPILGALHRLTKTIPIVFTLVTDPVSDGFVASLARPGGNITGFTIFDHSFAGKWLEMLKEVAPGMTRVAAMQNPDHPAWNAYLRAIGTIAAGMGIEVTPAPVTNAADVVAAIEAFARVPNGGLIILPSPVGTAHREVIASAALRHRLPSIYLSRMYAVSGGLMAYGIVLTEPYRQAATYVDRILKGAKPAELPVQAASKFEMVINLRTAKALGITVPATMLGRADEVIE
jgi:putative tryptophan/tyrosine transport system substrate-binding protein